MPEPNNTPQPSSGFHPSVQIAQVVMQGFIVALTLYLTWLGNRNSDKIESVQRQVDEKSEQVLDKQDVASEKQKKIKEKLDVVPESDPIKDGLILFATWKYLQDVASGSGDPKDKEAEAQARKLYEEYLRKKNAPKKD